VARSAPPRGIKRRRGAHGL